MLNSVQNLCDYKHVQTTSGKKTLNMFINRKAQDQLVHLCDQKMSC